MDAFRQHRTWKRARRLGLSRLACLGRHTVAGMICAAGHQADDWSADYRSNEQGPAIPVPKWQAKSANQRVSTQKLLQVLRSEIWAYAIERLEKDSNEFVIATEPTTKSQESEIPLESAVLFARAG